MTTRRLLPVLLAASLALAAAPASASAEGDAGNAVRCAGAGTDVAAAA